MAMKVFRIIHFYILLYILYYILFFKIFEEYKIKLVILSQNLFCFNYENTHRLYFLGDGEI